MLASVCKQLAHRSVSFHASWCKRLQIALGFYVLGKQLDGDDDDICAWDSLLCNVCFHKYYTMLTTLVNVVESLHTVVGYP